MQNNLATTIQAKHDRLQILTEHDKAPALTPTEDDKAPV